eukprot:1861892-Rhodomonas_salina.1
MSGTDVERGTENAPYGMLILEGGLGQGSHHLRCYAFARQCPVLTKAMLLSVVHNTYVRNELAALVPPPILLRPRFEMSGTDRGYAPTSRQHGHSGALSAYARATRSPVLMSRTALSGYKSGRCLLGGRGAEGTTPYE